MPDKKSLWSEYKNAEGRTYWAHATTKQSVWEKPDELRTPFERALAKTDWKQYTSKDRPYYVNSKTKETKWDLPEALVKLKKKVEREEEYLAERDRRREQGLPSPTPPPRTPSPARSITPTDFNAVARYSAPREPEIRAPVKPLPPRWPVGGFLKYEQAEDAFMKLLAYYDTDENSIWEETHRKIITHELYKALDTLAEKKAAFEKYQRKIVTDRQAAKEARIAKLRPMLQQLFANTPEIRSFSTIKTADRVFRHDRHWRQALPDEREGVLDAYTAELRAKEETEERELKRRNIDALTSLIRTLGMSVSTRWRQAHDLVVSSDAFKADQNLQKIDTIDILNAYDDYARDLEKEHEEESKALRIKKSREARRARDGFRDYLHGLAESGELTRSSRWKDLYPTIKTDERYTALLGHPGSTPLDLFMDAVDDLGEETERAAEKINKAFSNTGREIALETSLEQFEEWVKEAHMDTQIEVKLRREVHSLVTGKLKQAAADEQRRAERKRRHRIDDLRYALREVSRLEVDMTYEEALPLIHDLKEFKEVDAEEDRRAAFDKYIKRQKEKLREVETSEGGSAHGRDSRRYSKSRRDDVDVDDDYDRKERKREDRKDRYREKDDRREDRHDDREEKRSRRDRRDRSRSREGEADRRDTRNTSRERRNGKRYDSASLEPEPRASKRPRVSSIGSPRPNGKVDKEAGEVEEGEI